MRLLLIFIKTEYTKQTEIWRHTNTNGIQTCKTNKQTYIYINIYILIDMIICNFIIFIIVIVIEIVFVIFEYV